MFITQKVTQYATRKAKRSITTTFFMSSTSIFEVKDSPHEKYADRPWILQHAGEIDTDISNREPTTLSSFISTCLASLIGARIEMTNQGALKIPSD